MSDFLGDLELELMRAADRIAATPRPSIRRRAGSRVMARLADLRAVGSGAMMAASAGVVAVVLAVVAVSGMHRSTGPDGSASSGHSGVVASAAQTCGSLAAAVGVGWQAVTSAPGRGLRDLLHVGHDATAEQRRVALEDLDQTVAGATRVYVRDVRVVQLAHRTRVTLVGAQACATVGLAGGVPRSSAPQSSVLAEVRSAHGVATIPLGTVSQIRSGAVFRDRALLLRGRAQLESIAMVPAGVVRVVCHALAGNATQQFPVVDRLTVIPDVSARSHCDLVHRSSQPDA